MAKSKSVKKAKFKVGSASKGSAVAKPKSKVFGKAKTKTQMKTKVQVKGKSLTTIKSTLKSKAESKSPVKSKAKVSGKKKVKANPKTRAAAPIKSVSKGKNPRAVVSSTNSFSKSEKWTATSGDATKIISDFSEFLTPLDDRIVVSISAELRRTLGGLFIPETVNEVSGNKTGTVVAVGRGHKDKKGKLRPMDVKKGDKVLFSTYVGAPIEWQNSKFLILRENEVLGIVAS